MKSLNNKMQKTVVIIILFGVIFASCKIQQKQTNIHQNQNDTLISIIDLENDLQKNIDDST